MLDLTGRMLLRRFLLVVPLLLAYWMISLLSIHRPIQYDEAFTYLRYAKSPLVALFAYELPNNHLIHSFGVWLTTSLMGDSLIAIRFVSVASALLCAAQLIRLTSKISTLGAGLLAASLLLIVPLWAEMVANARGYTLSAFLTLVFIEMLYFSGETPSRNRTRALMGICILLMLTLPTMALLIAAACLWVIWRAWNSRNPALMLASYLPPLIVGTLIGGLFYTTVFIYGNASSHATTFGEEGLSALVLGWLAQVFVSLPAVILAVGVIFGLVALWASHRRMIVLLGIVLGVVLSLSLVQEIVTGKVFFARNFYYLIPLVTLLSGMGLAALSRAKPPLVTAVVLTCLLLGANHFQTLNAPSEISQLAEAIKAKARDGDVILISCCLDFPINYMHRQRQELFHFTTDNKRVIFVPTAVTSLEGLMAYNHQNGPQLVPETCQQEQWGRTEITVCLVQ